MSILNRQSMKLLSLALPFLLARKSVDAFSVAVSWLQLPNTSSLLRPTTTVESPPCETELQGQMQELLDTEFVRRRGQEEEDALSQADLPNLYRARTVQDCQKLLADGDGKLTVVQFSAPFCLACKAMSPLFHKLAKDSPDINFVLLAVTKENRHDVKALGIPSLPYGYIHHPTRGVVEKLSTHKRHFADFTRIVDSYRERACELPDAIDAKSKVFASPFARIR